MVVALDMGIIASVIVVLALPVMTAIILIRAFKNRKK